MQEVIDALPAHLAQPLSGAERISQVENRLEIGMRAMLTKCLNDTRFPVVRAFAYLIRRELQMRNLLAVVKGKNLGFDTGLIRYAANLDGDMHHD